MILLPILLILGSAYLIWVILRARHPEQNMKNDNTPSKKSKGDIVGKSHYIPLVPKIEPKPGKNESSEDDNDDIDYIIEDEEDIEEDAEEVEGAVTGIAAGVSFEELTDTVNTADNYSRASERQKVDAGNVLLEIKETDMLEQIVSGKTNRADAVSDLLRNRISAFMKEKEIDNPLGELKAVPEDFDISDFVTTK